MSAPQELNHPNDFVILTVDVADSPIAELRLSEIYDVETSTMNDDYLLVVQNYIALQHSNSVCLVPASSHYTVGQMGILSLFVNTLLWSV
jgi:hypothetical protein